MKQGEAAKDDLMAFFAQRERKIANGYYDAYPTFPGNSDWEDWKRQAIKAQGERDESDPFAGRRTLSRVNHGLVHPRKVAQNGESI